MTSAVIIDVNGLSGNHAEEDQPDYNPIENPDLSILDAVQLSTGILIRTQGAVGYREEQGWNQDWFLVRNEYEGGPQSAYQLYGRPDFGDQFEGLSLLSYPQPADFSIEELRGGKIGSAFCWQDVELDSEALLPGQIEALNEQLANGDIPVMSIRDFSAFPEIITLPDGRLIVNFDEYAGQEEQSFIVDGDQIHPAELRRLSYEEIKDIRPIAIGGFEIDGIEGAFIGFNVDNVGEYRYFDDEGTNLGTATVVLDPEEQQKIAYQTHSAAFREIAEEIDNPEPETICPPLM